MIRNGGASFVTLDTGLQLYAFSLFRLELKPRRRDSAEEAHCSADSHGNAERSVGGYQGQACLLYTSDIKIRKEAETMYQKLMTCLESVRKKKDFKPEKIGRAHV